MGTPAALLAGPPAAAPGRRTLAIDVAMIAVAPAITVATMAHDDRPLRAGAIALATAGTSPLLAWRRAPDARRRPAARRRRRRRLPRRGGASDGRNSP